jgi:SAM-dependent methyltransferase
MTSRDRIIDRAGVLDRLEALQRVELELGCGTRKRKVSSIGIDASDSPGVDIVGDVFDVLSNFPSASVDHVSSFHFFEHIANLRGLLGELSRVQKSGGTLEIVVPHFSSPYFYSDYTHQRPFGLYTFCYLAKASMFARQVPTYGARLAYELTNVRLGFKSPKPFYLRYAFKRAVGSIFNASTYLMELWEENFCYIFPCYEISYSLKRLSD